MLSNTIHIKLDIETRQVLEAIALREDRPLSWVVRRILSDYAERVDRTPGTPARKTGTKRAS